MAHTAQAWTTNSYPHTRRSDHVDVYKSEAKGEVRVANPYNWLEEQSEETDKWVSEQEAFTRKYLDQYPNRTKLENEIKANLDYEKFSAPSLKKDGRWYWTYNTGLQAQSVIYRSKTDKLPDLSKASEAVSDETEVFFDPNLLSEDGTAAFATTSFSRCGKYFAYGISLSGSDVFTCYVRSTDKPLATIEKRGLEHDTGRMSDVVRFMKFSGVSWTKDSKGFFYQRFPSRETHAAEEKAGIETMSDKDAMLYYHRIGTPQSEDILVMKDAENPTFMWAAQVSEVDGKYLQMDIRKDTSRKVKLWIADLEESQIGQNMKWLKLVDEFEASYEILGNDGTKFYLRTNKDAPKYKVVTVDIGDKDVKFQDLIPEEKDATLATAEIVGDNLILNYTRNVKDEVYIYTLAGKKVARVAEDFIGTITLSSRRDQTWFFATLVGFTTPGQIARYDFTEKDEAKRWSIYRVTAVKGLKAEDFNVEQVWFNSKDGTRVPMFLVRHRLTPIDGTAPALQYGYGGFTIPVNPYFSVFQLTFLQKYRAVLAVANIRGGGEFGEDWHQAGIRERKVNVFDDFIAATEHLKKNKIADPKKISINGASNGGLLVAACATRAPEGTFGAAIADVGVLDYLKFADFTIGRAWTSDYGNPHDPHDFDFMYPLSPLHNIPTDKILPPLMLNTADHDDRVVPLHSFKMAAALQYTLPHNPHPLLLRVDKKAGHGAGKTTDQRIKECADKWSFIAQSIGLPYYED